VSKCYSVNDDRHCFYTDGSILNVIEAREFCVRRNSTLPTITDENIDNVFQQFIVNDSNSVIGNRSVWLDAHARLIERWRWIDGHKSGMNDSLVSLVYIKINVKKLTSLKLIVRTMR